MKGEVAVHLKKTFREERTQEPQKKKARVWTQEPSTQAARERTRVPSLSGIDGDRKAGEVHPAGGSLKRKKVMEMKISGRHGWKKAREKRKSGRRGEKGTRRRREVRKTERSVRRKEDTARGAGG